ncbi:MAG: hypothetical protein WBG36_09355 [Ornithinimicrobium sp.]
MARVFSFADPTVGSVTLAATVEDNEILQIMHDWQGDRAATQDKLDRWLWEKDTELFAHEWAHILQVATYPLLYLRAARRARRISQWAFAVRDLPNGETLPLFGQLDERSRDSDLIEVVRVRLILEPGGIRMEPMASLRPRRGVIQELDLVEEEATIFQYRATIGSRGSGHGYRHWLAESSRYSAIFSFLSTFCTDDQALALLPVLARISLHTLHPLQSFAGMLTDIVRDGADTYTKDYADQEWEIWAEDFFKSRLMERVDEAISPRELFLADALDDKQGYITDESFDELIEFTPHLPMGALARWNRGEDGLLDNVLRAPWSHIDRDGAFDPRLERFRPPLSVYRLTGMQSGAERAMVLPSAAMRNIQAPRVFQLDEDSTLMLSTIVLELWKAAELLDAALGVRGPIIACPHAQCRFHSKGLCEGWPQIPQEFEDCTFPEWLSARTGKTVSPDGRHLIQEPSQTVNASDEGGVP